MSRTIRFHKFGSAEVLKCEEHEVAAPAPGEVQVRVEAIGISWYDVLWRQNLAPSHARLPAGIGQEMAGVVTAVGEGVSDLKPGDKVASFPAHSANDYPSYGEQVLMPRSALTLYPQVLSPVEASVHYTPLLIAYFAYVDLARVKPGQPVFLCGSKGVWIFIRFAGGRHSCGGIGGRPARAGSTCAEGWIEQRRVISDR